MEIFDSLSPTLHPSLLSIAPGSSYTEWNDKIVALEKTTWFHFHLMKTGFLILLQTIY